MKISVLVDMNSESWYFLVISVTGWTLEKCAALFYRNPLKISVLSDMTSEESVLLFVMSNSLWIYC